MVVGANRALDTKDRKPRNQLPTVTNSEQPVSIYRTMGSLLGRQLGTDYRERIGLEAVIVAIGKVDLSVRPVALSEGNESNP